MKRPLASLCFSLCIAQLCLAMVGCTPKSTTPLAPSQVQRGQLYQSGQSEFDTVFRELHDLQQQLALAAEEERQIRKQFATAIGVEDGATRQALGDRIAAKSAELAAKKVRLKLDVEGLEADDEADTMAQAKLVGSLDEGSQKVVEATALAARQELRFAARLRRAQKRMERLAQHASALEPWVDATFGGQGAGKAAEVKHNLEDARRQFPLLTVRASELAEEARKTVQRLAQAMTNDASIGSAKEPPLIAPADGAAPKRPKAAMPAASVKKPALPPKPAETGGGSDFEP